MVGLGLQNRSLLLELWLWQVLADTLPRPKMLSRTEILTGCLWGCAVGDAIGLPYEGLSVRRARRFARLPLKHRFVFGRGMVSDDTDHTVFVAQALLPAIEAITQAGGDVDTIAAIAGALAGMSAGPASLPQGWRGNIVDWPHSLGYLRQLAAALADPTVTVATAFSHWLFVRGIVFTVLVLAHGFRRLLPPY